MKKDFRKLYWTIILILGVFASVCSLCYSITFKADMPIEEQATAAMFWNLSYWTAVVFILFSIISALGFALVHIGKGIIEQPKKQMGIIIGVGALVLILVLSYAFASGTDIPKELFDKTGSNYDSSKLIGGSLYAVYILMAGVIISVLYAEIAKKIK